LLLYLGSIDCTTLPETDNRFLVKLVVAMDATNNHFQRVRRAIASLDPFGPGFDDGRDEVDDTGSETESGSC